MPAFFLAFLAVGLAILAGRESLRVARLSAARGGAAGVWLALLGAGLAAAAIAASLARELAEMLEPAQRLWLAAAALLMAAIEVFAMRAPPPPREAAQSLGATMLVLFAELLTGAAGLLVIALSAALGNPLLSGAGGAIGAVAALSVAALAREDWDRLPHGLMRLTGAGALLTAALVSGFSAL